MAAGTSSRRSRVAITLVPVALLVSAYVFSDRVNAMVDGSASSSGMVDLVRPPGDPSPPATSQLATLASGQAATDKHPDRLAGVWVDADSGQVLLGYVPPLTGAPADAVAAIPGLRTVAVERSAADLERVMEQVLGVPGAEPVNRASFDWARNQVRVAATDITTEARRALYEEFGDAVVMEAWPSEEAYLD